MSRTTTVKDGLMVRQLDPDADSIVVPDKSIKYEQLSNQIKFGLLPLGSVMPIMPHVTGSFQPSGSGTVSGGFIRCDGAVIPLGMKVTGTTPDLTADPYLRGASITTGSSVGSNSKSINTPQLPVHSHGVVLGFSNAPHGHPVGAMAEGPDKTLHGHAATTAGKNIPHNHTINSGTTNAPHSHPIGITAANMPHSHVGNTGNATGSVLHGHNGSFSTTASLHAHTMKMWNRTGSASTHYWDIHTNSGGFGSTSQLLNTNNGPSLGHNHGGAYTAPASNAPHSHAATIGNAGGSHRHISTSGTATHKHNHTSSVAAANIPHNHPASTGAVNMLHTHPASNGPSNMPHTHPGSTIGNTGSGDAFSFEPQYMNCVYIMRVR